MKYIVFGSSGLLGKSLVSYLESNEQEVIAVSRKANFSYAVDISSVDSFAALQGVENTDVIINCASVLPDHNFPLHDPLFLKQLFDTNVIGAVNILNFAASKGVNKVINCSTLSVVNKPWPVPLTIAEVTYPQGRHVGYSASKLSQELLMNEVAKSFNIDLIHLRLSALYGPTMSGGILPQLIEKGIKGEKITLTNAHKTSFDFLHVKDLSRIIFNLSNLPSFAIPVLNVASGQEIYLEELAQLIVTKTASGSFIENSNTNASLSRSVVDIKPLKSLLNNDWKITSIEDGIEELISTYRNEKTCAT